MPDFKRCMCSSRLSNSELLLSLPGLVQLLQTLLQLCFVGFSCLSGSHELLLLLRMICHEFILFLQSKLPTLLQGVLRGLVSNLLLFNISAQLLQLCFVQLRR